MISKEINKMFFVGIGGIGMSAIARYFIHLGYSVAGYDRVESAVSQSLQKLGAIISLNDTPEILDDEWKDKTRVFVIYTPAIKKSELLQFFSTNKFSIHKRAEVLGEIFNQYKGLAVAGTHGKTTTSAILAHIFKSSKQASASFIGGIMKNYDSNFVIEADPEYVIAEADEFDYSFLKLKPQKAIITSIDPDHLDIYQNKEIFEQAFIDFVKNVDSDGLVLLSNTIDIKLIKHINIKTYGIEGNADIIALNIKPSGDTYVFDIQFFGDVVWLDVTLGISGLINVSNALAATILAYESGISEESIREALASFKGIKRRFDIWFDDKQRAFVDDYAHHPEEIKTLYKGLRHKFGGRKLVAIFQPHLYSRTKDFAVNFASALSLFDEQIVLPIYPARELPIKGVTSNIIFDKIKSEKKYLFTKLETTEFLKRNSVSAVYITIGAGDIDRELEQWSEIIKSQIL